MGEVGHTPHQRKYDSGEIRRHVCPKSQSRRGVTDDLSDLVGELFDVAIGTFRLHSGRGVTNEEECQRSRYRSTTGRQEIGGTPSAAVDHGHEANS